MSGPDCIEAQACRGDFWLTMREAIVQAGGCASLVEELAGQPLTKTVDFLAQNGIRMVYVGSAHLNNITSEHRDD